MGQRLKGDTKIQGIEKECWGWMQKQKNKVWTPANKMGGRGGHVCKLVENTRIQTQDHKIWTKYKYTNWQIQTEIKS